MSTLSLFATAPAGIADLLAGEIRELGGEAVKEARAGVSFSGTLETAYRTCLWSRVANRVLLPLASFPAGSPDELYRGVQGIDWLKHLSPAETIAVDANVSSSEITHSHFAAQRVKDAIVDQVLSRAGARPSVSVDRPDVQVNVYLNRNEATLYLDLSGSSLHQRNYRLESGDAPLKENLAAAILMRARWPALCEERSAFADLMCGSGTLLVEAAMIAADIAPGLLRDYFGFLGWKQHNAQLWQRLVNEAGYRKEKGLARLPVMLGFDADRRMIAKAEANADRAGLGGRIQFIYQDLFNFRHDFPEKGLMVTNPPYGRRLNETGELPALYRALGKVMRENLKGWHAAVFTEDQALGKYIGIRAQRIHSLYNGAVACKLIHFNVDEGDFFSDSRLPSRVADEKLSEHATGFANRLRKNLKEVRRWAAREGVFCYRLYDADLPDYNAAVDIYSHAARPDETWVCIQEYEAPKTVDERRVRQRTRELVTICQSVLEVDEDHLFYKTRARQRGNAQYERVETTKNFHEVTEGAASLLVNFEDYLDTGLFLDHRPLRLRIGEESKDRDVLNLFCYTGAATVHAAMGGARSTVSVDLSRTYLDWAQRNLELNGLASGAHRLVRQDCISWLAAQAKSGKQQFDLIFLDPPTFSNSKRMDDTFDVQRDQDELVVNARRLLRDGGRLYFSTNRRGFRLSEKLEALGPADISQQTIPFDFRRKPGIHRCWMFEV